MSAAGKVNIAVCGKFHILNYTNMLADGGRLNKVYFSHKRGTTAKLGLRPEHAVNVFLKEYLLQGSRRIFGDRISKWSDPLTGRLWARQVLSRWSRADILHFLAHGHALPLVTRARADGAKVLAEMVNTHHANQRDVYLRECERWNIRPIFQMGDAGGQRLDEEGHRADLILVPGDHVRKSFIANGFAAEKLVKIPFGANLKAFFSDAGHPASSPARPLKVICVGQIGLRKGQLYLLEAVRKLGPRVVELTLVGHISQDNAPLVAGYDGAFTHLPHVDNAELRKLLHAHDVFVLPSLEEGMAVANCEALAAGLCVVTTEESGGGEIIRHGENGFLIAPGSAEAIAAQLLSLHADRDLVRATGEAAARDMRSFSGWGEYVRQLEAVYDRLLT